jgi:hypothetical protein
MFGLHLVSFVVGALAGGVATVTSSKVYAWVKKQTASAEAKADSAIAAAKADVGKKL